jgi:ADP-heptose:LPS heptosyltransferase
VALSRPARILVLRALGVGDLLAGVPALRALRRGLPDARISLAAPGLLAPLVSLAGVADEVVDTAGPVTPRWAGAPPDLAVNLHGRGPQSHRALAVLAPGRLVAFGCAAAEHVGPSWSRDEHERHRWCRLVHESLGLAADAADLRLAVPERAPLVPGAVVVHPGAAAESRRWPLSRFAAVARWATGQGRPVVVTGSAGEAALAARVGREAGLPPGAVLAGRTDLVDLAAQVAAASLVVCGDTGVAHLASAYATPSVVLFGPTPPAEWGPPPGPHAALWRGTGRGDPHGDRVDPALAAIRVDDVVRRAAELVRTPVTRTPTAPASGRRTSPGCV